jgi:hypothetical protein
MSLSAEDDKLYAITRGLGQLSLALGVCRDAGKLARGRG